MRIALAALLALTACQTTGRALLADPPPLVLGDHTDDYGIGYAVTPWMWTQTPGGRYHVSRWRTAPGRRSGTLVAQNDTVNVADGGRWTRIDWVRLDGHEPYVWAFCLSAYDAVSAEAAQASAVADTEPPRTGCNGYPFSRMRRPAAP